MSSSSISRVPKYAQQIAKLFAREPKWRVAPFAVTYFKHTKERVYFDHDNRPILRVGPGGDGMVIAPDALICFSLLRDLHLDLEGRYDPDGLRVVAALITEHGLASELQRRWALLLRGELPEPAWGGRS